MKRMMVTSVKKVTKATNVRQTTMARDPWRKVVFALLCVGLLTHVAFASTTGQGNYPWEGFLNTIATSLDGPVALAVGVIAIAVCGLVMAFADLQSGGKRAITIGLGLSIAFTATTIVSKLFHASGAIIH